MGRRQTLQREVFCFGPFIFDARSLELRKHGLRLRLADQPGHVLALLLERAGEVVSREELRALLWSSDTFVDFERSLNAAVAKLRQALSDSAVQPLYIETMSRRGYRFIAPLTEMCSSRQDGSAAPEFSPAADELSTPDPTLARLSTTWLWVSAALALALLTFSAGYIMRRPASGSSPIRFLLSPPQGFTFASSYHPRKPAFGPDDSVSVSSDGRELVFVAADQTGQTALWVRPLESEVALKLDNTEGAQYPFWSPDSHEIGFFADSKLKKIPAHGGPVQVLASAVAPQGGAWNRDGIILFSSNELYRVPSAGGGVTQVTHVNHARGEIFHSLPQFLPDGRTFIYWVAVFRAGRYPAPESEIRAGSLESPEGKLLFTNRTGAIVAGPSSLVFVRDGLLMEQRADFKRLRPMGDPVPLADSVNALHSRVASFATSPGGVLIYRALSPPTPSRLAWYSRTGRRLSSVGPPGDYIQLFLSPNERMAALTTVIGRDPSRYNIWMLQLDTNILSRLTFGERDADPVWSSDSRSIIYNGAQPKGSGNDLMQLTLGESSPQVIYKDGYSNKTEAWSPDGRSIIFRRDEVAAFRLAADGRGKPAILLDTPFLKGRFSFAPSGRWLAFVDSDTELASPAVGRSLGSWRIYVAEYPSMSKRHQISAGYGCTPLWRGDGKELFYMGAKGEIMSVGVKPQTHLETGPPTVLFRPAVGDVDYCYGKYGVSRDGQRFLVLEAPEQDLDPQMHVIMHWNPVPLPN